MSTLFLLRHGPTSWNAEHRIQGRTDIELSDAAKHELANTVLSAHWKKFKWYASPLLRAQQTARLLGPDQIHTIADLIEMNWGDFEGMRLAEVEAKIIDLGLQPDKGLDLQPPHGESPRMVRNRLAKWLQTLDKDRQTTHVGVTHKGVIRAMLSLATGWDMQDKFRHKIDWRLPIRFTIDSTAKTELVEVNCAFDLDKLP